jgi:hypothetical protein
MKRIVTLAAALILLGSDFARAQENYTAKEISLGPVGDIYGDSWSDANTVGGRFGFIPNDATPIEQPVYFETNFDMNLPSDLEDIGCDGFDFLAQIKANMSGEAIVNWMEQLGTAIVSAAPGLLLNYIAPDIKSFLDGLQNLSLARFNMSQAKCREIVDAAKGQKSLGAVVKNVTTYSASLLRLKMGKEQERSLAEMMNMSYVPEEVREINRKADQETPLTQFNWDGTLRKPTGPNGYDEYDVITELLDHIQMDKKPLDPEYKATVAAYLGSYFVQKKPIPEGKDQFSYTTVETKFPKISPREIYMQLCQKLTPFLDGLVSGYYNEDGFHDIREIRYQLYGNGFPAAVNNMTTEMFQGLVNLKNDPGAPYADTLRHVASAFAQMRLTEFLYEILDMLNVAQDAKYMDQYVLDLVHLKAMKVQEDLDTELERYPSMARNYITSSQVLEQLTQQVAQRDNYNHAVRGMRQRIGPPVQ